MSKKIYVPSSGLSHKTTKLRVGINNVSRNVVKGYIGINGSAKQFWPDEPVYVWNRYNVDPKYTYSVVYKGSYNSTWSKQTSGSFAKFAAFDSNTGQITLSNIQTYDYRWLLDHASMTVMDGYITIYNTKFDLGWSPNEVYSTSAREGTFSQWYRIGITSTNRIMIFSRPDITSSISDYIRGSYLDQVTSKMRGSYPDDGVQGGYWYVYVGER